MVAPKPTAPPPKPAQQTPPPDSMTIPDDTTVTLGDDDTASSVPTTDVGEKYPAEPELLIDQVPMVHVWASSYSNLHGITTEPGKDYWLPDTPEVANTIVAGFLSLKDPNAKDDE